MSAVTQLFLMHETPVREGVYKLSRIDGNPAIWAWWNGYWTGAALTPLGAQQAAIWPFYKNVTELPGVIGWRGLAENPNA